MSISKILCIDLGTSNTKGFVVDNNYEISFQTELPVKSNLRKSEIDPQTVLESVRRIIELSTTEKCDYLTFTNAMHTLLVTDSNLDPLTPVYTWADNRSEGHCINYLNKYGNEEYYHLTRVPAHPLLPFFKILWLNDHQSFKKVNGLRYVSLKDWIIFQLTGKLITDTTTAASFGMMDSNDNHWSETLMTQAGINKNQLSTIVAPETSIDYDTPLIIGATDGVMANYFINQIPEHISTMVITAGTSAAVRITTQKTDLPPGRGIFSYQLKKEQWVTGLASNNAGNILQELNLNPGELLDLDKIRKNDPIFLPYLNNERAPIWPNRKKSGFSDMDTAEKIGYKDSIILEGILLNIKRMFESISELKKPDHIIVSGGMFKSAKIAQDLSTVLQRNLIIPHTVQSSTFGAVKFALNSLNIENLSTLKIKSKIRFDNSQNDLITSRYSQFMNTLL